MILTMLFLNDEQDQSHHYCSIGSFCTVKSSTEPKEDDEESDSSLGVFSFEQKSPSIMKVLLSSSKVVSSLVVTFILSSVLWSVHNVYQSWDFAFFIETGLATSTHEGHPQLPGGVAGTNDNTQFLMKVTTQLQLQSNKTTVERKNDIAALPVPENGTEPSVPPEFSNYGTSSNVVQVFVVTAVAKEVYRSRYLVNAEAWQRHFDSIHVFTFDEIPRNLSLNTNNVHQVKMYDFESNTKVRMCKR